jgi:alginate O-acetyltransferase complex protein AlgI
VAVRRIYVLFAVMVSFVLFNGTDLAQVGTDLAGLFGGIPMTTAESVYYLRSYAGVFLFSVIGATPLVKTLAGRIPEKAAAVLEPLVLMALLLICTGYLVDGSFNPFLYFRF